MLAQMLRNKLFAGFAVLVVMFSLTMAFLGLIENQKRILQDAQNRVRLDLESARSVLNGRLSEIELIVRMIGSKQIVFDTAAAENWQDQETLNRLMRARTTFGLDFLNVIAADGQVKVRTTAPNRVGDYHASGDSTNAARVAVGVGDYRGDDPAVAGAIRGKVTTCVVALNRYDLEKEGEKLAEQAFIVLEDTKHARPTLRREESRGMAIVSAAPVMRGNQVVAVVYGGILLNRNNGIVDRIHDIVFKNEVYKGVSVGTATLFLGDTRVATTVRMGNGNRAIGTRVSKEVADRVLDNGEPWLGEAFVVRERYLAAYEPIRDGTGATIGMLYVGTLKRPFEDYARATAMKYVCVTMMGLLVGLALAFVIASRLAAPIHRLVEASNRMTNGDRPPPVTSDSACHETSRLIRAFNEMAATLAEREERLKALNRSYMETLGFVSHELKSPVATIMNYTYLLKEQRLGPLTEKQVKAVRAIDSGGGRLIEMVRHYLNLARIENGELEPVCADVDVGVEILQSLLESVDADVQERRMRIENAVGPGVVARVDRNMVREVFENLVSNAIKYGREGGAIAIAARDDGRMVNFTVRNEGPGIPEERMPQLFQKFSRLEGTDGAKRQKGTGLGLFITKTIVEAHGGRIEARSKSGEWVEFAFTLPCGETRREGETGKGT
jgi:two-component system NtrC family sensor kinase